MQGFASGDNGNAFPFGAVNEPASYFCTETLDADKCHRVTSLAFYDNTDVGQHYLALWPFQDKLEVFQESNGSAVLGAGTISASSSTSVTGSSCSSGSCPGCTGGSCFLSQVIPGDSLVAGGCTLGSNCPIVTSVTDDTHVTVSSALNVSGASWHYAGFFINRSADATPSDSGSGYAGGALTVASNSDSQGVIWAVLAAPTTPYYFNGTRTAGTLFAYNFSPTSANTLTKLWSSDNLGITGFCAAPFARPTVANGLVFVPTWALGATCPPASGATSGIIVYGL